jgi:hypothetical protein
MQKEKFKLLKEQKEMKKILNKKMFEFIIMNKFILIIIQFFL